MRTRRNQVEIRSTGRPRFLRRAGRGTGVLMLALASASAKGLDATPQYVEQGNQAFAKGDYAGAVEAYSKACESAPESSEVAYNLAAAYYKQGELARAKSLLINALATRNAELEARAKFNLGNVAYRQALAKQSSVPEAVKLLQTAITHYRDALEVNESDDDARANIELAQRLIEDLQNKQQQDRRQGDPRDSDRKDEQKEQPSDKQPQSQAAGPQTQPDKGQENNRQKEQSGNDQQNQARQQNAPEQQGAEEKDKPPSQGDQASQPDPSSAGDKQEGETEPMQARPLSREEADRLLQSVRDRERERRQKTAAYLQAERMNVKRDW